MIPIDLWDAPGGDVAYMVISGLLFRKRLLRTVLFPGPEGGREWGVSGADAGSL